jgi:hypothetical protein
MKRKNTSNKNKIPQAGERARIIGWPEFLVTPENIVEAIGREEVYLPEIALALRASQKDKTQFIPAIERCFMEKHPYCIAEYLTLKMLVPQRAIVDELFSSWEDSGKFEFDVDYTELVFSIGFTLRRSPGLS